MRAGFSIYELDVDPQPISAALHRTFKHITDAEFAANLFYVDVLALVGKGRVARDHEGARDARQVRRQAFGDAVHELILFRVTPQIGKGKDHNRKARRCGGRRSFGLRGLADFERVGPDWFGPVSPGALSFEDRDSGCDLLCDGRKAKNTFARTASLVDDIEAFDLGARRSQCIHSCFLLGSGR